MNAKASVPNSTFSGMNGGARVDWQCVFIAAVYSLVRIRNLMAVA